MQMVAKKVAEEYNKLKPPNRIDFLECFVLEERTPEESRYWCCEKFISGAAARSLAVAGVCGIPCGRWHRELAL